MCPEASWRPVADDDWLDVIALAASEAREHAEKAAVTEIGPATVEQFTADIVRLARAYVSAPPLPLFAPCAGHSAASRQRLTAGPTRLRPET